MLEKVSWPTQWLVISLWLKCNSNKLLIPSKRPGGRTEILLLCRRSSSREDITGLKNRGGSATNSLFERSNLFKTSNPWRVVSSARDIKLCCRDRDSSLGRRLKARWVRTFSLLLWDISRRVMLSNLQLVVEVEGLLDSQETFVGRRDDKEDNWDDVGNVSLPVSGSMTKLKLLLADNCCCWFTLLLLLTWVFTEEVACKEAVVADKGVWREECTNKSTKITREA